MDAAATMPPFEVQTEADLVRRLKAGDEEAFEALVRSYGGRLLSVAKRFFVEPEDARDALQEAFLSAFQAIGRFEGQARLSTWLHRIVVNSCLMRLRTAKRRPEEPIEPFLPAFDEMGMQKVMSMPWPSMEDEAARRQASSRLRELIGRLPESYRAVLLLRDIEDLTTAETALHLDVPESTVKIRLHRARQALRGLIDPEMRKALR